MAIGVWACLQIAQAAPLARAGSEPGGLWLEVDCEPEEFEREAMVKVWRPMGEMDVDVEE